jgi:putative transposase
MLLLTGFIVWLRTRNFRHSPADTFAEPTTAPNQLWQTDFTYLRVIGWGWFYLSTVLDDFSRYILAWKLCTTMTATDVSDTLAMALRSSGLERVRVRHRPRLLSDNGPSYVSAQLGSWLAEHGMKHTRGKPYHPMTQGKIERYHRSMKNQILLENYYLPGQSTGESRTNRTETRQESRAWSSPRESFDDFITP